MAPEVIGDPYPLYREMRAQHPVYFSETLGAWVLTRYEDVRAVLRDPARFGSAARAVMIERQLSLQGVDRDTVKDYLELCDTSMLLKDPPEHTRMRKIANCGFTRAALESWRDVVRKVAVGLLEAVHSRRHMDITKDLAQRLPAIVIATLLKIPREDREAFQKWADDLATLFGQAVSKDIHEVARLGNNGTCKLKNYIRKLIKRRQQQPGVDMVSRMIVAYEKGRVNINELVTLLILILTAGHVTTIDQLSNGMYHLLKQPAQWQLLRENPALIKPAIEEMLRFDTSVPYIHRVAIEDVELRGKRIPRGSVVALALGAANHDPEVFEDPDAFDIRRNPTKHISFAVGPHTCLGLDLARMELQIALEELRQRMPNLHLDPKRPPLPKHETLMLKGFHSLPVRF